MCGKKKKNKNEKKKCFSVGLWPFSKPHQFFKLRVSGPFLSGRLLSQLPPPTAQPHSMQACKVGLECLDAVASSICRCQWRCLPLPPSLQTQYKMYQYRATAKHSVLRSGQCASYVLLHQFIVKIKNPAMRTVVVTAATAAFPFLGKLANQPSNLKPG